MTKPIIIGIDLGTQQLKIMVADLSIPSLVASVHAKIPAISNEPGALEHNPNVWWDLCCRLMRDLLIQLPLKADLIGAIGLSGHMHSFVPVDRDRKPTHNCIVWADSRAANYARQLSQQGNLKLWNPPIAAYTVPKLLWFRDRHPEAYAKTAHVLFPKDYLRLKLTGDLATDFSDASGTLAWDFTKRDWDRSLLELLRLNPSILPTPRNSAEIGGELTTEASKQLGLVPGIPVAIGAGDVACAVLGAGTIDRKSLLINAGTAAQVIQVDQPVKPYIADEGARYLFELGIEGRTFTMGALPSAGLSIEWWRNTVDPGMTYSDLDELTAETPSTPHEALFLPYLQGTGTPYVLDESLGAFLQLSPRTEVSRLTRAVMEGVAYGIKECTTSLVPNYLEEMNHIFVTGGIAKSWRMRQILTNVLGLPLRFKPQSDVSSLGALALGADALFPEGKMRELIQQLAPTDEVESPAPEVTKTYQANYQRYLQWTQRIVTLRKSPPR